MCAHRSNLCVQLAGGSSQSNPDITKSNKKAFHLSVYFFSLSVHSDSGHHGIGMLVMDHSLIHLLVRSHSLLIRLLRTACFAHALRCAHLFARSLTHSWDGRMFLSIFEGVLKHCAVSEVLGDRILHAAFLDNLQFSSSKRRD